MNALTFDRAPERRKARGCGHERREEILASARALFLEHGAQNVSTRLIAAHRRNFQTCLYVYFKNKDEMLDALVDVSLRKLGAALDAVNARFADPVEFLRANLREYIRFGLGHPDEYRLAFMLRDGRRRGGERARPVGDALFNVLQSRIEQGVAAEVRCPTRHVRQRSRYGRLSTVLCRCASPIPISTGFRSTSRSTRMSTCCCMGSLRRARQPRKPPSGRNSGLGARRQSLGGGRFELDRRAERGGLHEGRRFVERLAGLWDHRAEQRPGVRHVGMDSATPRRRPRHSRARSGVVRRRAGFRCRPRKRGAAAARRSRRRSAKPAADADRPRRDRRRRAYGRRFRPASDRGRG